MRMGIWPNLVLKSSAAIWEVPDEAPRLERCRRINEPDWQRDLLDELHAERMLDKAAQGTIASLRQQLCVATSRFDVTSNPLQLRKFALFQEGAHHRLPSATVQLHLHRVR